MLQNNRKEKSFSMLRILGTDFVVDFDLGEFRQVDNPSNKISFDNLKYDSAYDGYPLLFDKHTKNVYQGPIPSDGMYPNVERILIPELMQLGWVDRIALAYTIDKNGQVKDVESNRSRRLPTIKIDNTDFTIDLRLREFRQTDLPYNRIPFDELNQLPGNKISFFYDPLVKNVFKGSEEELHKRADIKFIKFPSLADLDPEGMKQRIREATAEARSDRNKPIVIPKETRPKDQDFFLSRSKRKGRGI